MEHVWGFEVWHESQLDRPMGQLPLQLPRHTGRITAPTVEAARAKVELGPGESFGAAQHHRYSCCKTWEPQA